jgi:hypothetical protein
MSAPAHARYRANVPYVRHLPNPAPEHARYLDALGIAARPLTDSITPKRCERPSGRPKSSIGIFTEGDLLALRGQVFWRHHDDEVREGFTVVLKRGGRTVGRLNCGSEELAWTAERICAGVRFKRGAE